MNCATKGSTNANNEGDLYKTEVSTIRATKGTGHLGIPLARPRGQRQADTSQNRRVVKNLKRTEKVWVPVSKFSPHSGFVTFQEHVQSRFEGSTILCGRLGDALGSHAGLHHRNRRPGTSSKF